MKSKDKRKMLKDYGLLDKAEYTVNDLVAAKLGSQRYLQKLVKEGKIQGVKRGRTYFIPKDNLISYLRGETQFKPVNPELINELCMYLDRLGDDPEEFFETLLIDMKNEYNRLYNDSKED